MPTYLLFGLLTCLLSIIPLSQANTILHAFNWRYSEVTDKAGEIARLGYKMVLVSPPLKSAGEEWWARYQPQDYRIIENPLGNTTDFKKMAQNLYKAGVTVYAEIVLNHMANESSERSDLSFPGKSVLDQYNSNPYLYSTLRLFGDLSTDIFSATDFKPPHSIRNYHSAHVVQNSRICGPFPDAGLPVLCPNERVIENQQNYLRSLKRMGVKGFRLDAAKHMHPDYIKRVINKDIKRYVHVFGDIATSGGIESEEYGTFLEPFLKESGFGAYDFPLFNCLFNSFRYGGSLKTLINPLAFGQSLQPDRAITFVITHDIPHNQKRRHLIMDEIDEKLAYAYILGRDGGVPLVLSDHNESGDNRWLNAYKSPHLAAMLKFHNTCQGLPMQIIGAGDGFLIFKRGHTNTKGIVAINKCKYEQEYWINSGEHKLAPRQTYCDMLNPSSKFKVSEQWIRLVIPERSAKMWLQKKVLIQP